MDDYQLLFDELNSLYSDDKLNNKQKTKEARDLFEKALKLKLEITKKEYIKLWGLYEEYIARYKPKEIRYTGQHLISKLNKYSHYTDDLLTDDELEDILVKLNKVFVTIFGYDNKIKSTGLQDEFVENNVYVDLNKEQKSAVNSKSRITFVNAGPGTGKTHLIVDRIIHKGLKKDDKNIIGLSFTNQAAITLKNKLDFKVYATKQSGVMENIFVGTIHSFAFKSMKSYHVEHLKVEYDYDIIDQEEFDEIKKEFSFNDEYIQEYLQNNKLLTFENILNEFIELLDNNTSFRDYMSDSIQEIIIDEAQDLDKKQYDIFHKLFSNSKTMNLFLVGDQRQNIFEFTGGSISNFKESFENEEIAEYDLVESYRCPQSVLNYVNSFVFNDCKNVDLTNNTNDGEKPILKVFSNQIEESNGISNLIYALISKDVSINDCAILSPSSFLFDNIASVLNTAEIPFKVFGGGTYLDPKIRFLINLSKSILLKKKYPLLKVISFWKANFSATNMGFKDILDYFNRTKYSKGSINKKLLLYMDFINMTIEIGGEFISLIEKFIAFSKQHSIFDDETIKSYQSFTDIIVANNIVDIDSINSKLTPQNNEFSQFYKKTANVHYYKPISGEYLTMSTIHSAKGKEWDHVIIPSLTQDLFPRYGSDYNTELKKFYVACTRSKKSLYLFQPMSYNTKSRSTGRIWTFAKPMSQFLSDAIPEYIISENN